MLGEIRDLETGEIVLREAQTGHLVLTTVNTKAPLLPQQARNIVTPR